MEAHCREAIVPVGTILHDGIQFVADDAGCDNVNIGALDETQISGCMPEAWTVGSGATDCCEKLLSATELFCNSVTTCAAALKTPPPSPSPPPAPVGSSPPPVKQEIKTIDTHLTVVGSIKDFARGSPGCERDAPTPHTHAHNIHVLEQVHTCARPLWRPAPCPTVD